MEGRKEGRRREGMEECGREDKDGAKREEGGWVRKEG